MIQLRKCDICLLILAAICAIISITTFIVFPQVYPKSVKSHLTFKQNKDMSLDYSAFMFSHPPSDNIMSFYFFNITNPDEMIYQGAKPILLEVGPYAVLEVEEKKYLEFNEDSTQVFYQNYKKYIIKPEYSCETCNFADIMTISNPTEVGAAADMYDPQFGVTPTGRIIITLGLMLLGETPFVSQPIGDILFDGYDDALLSAAHSNIMNILNGLNGGKSILPIPVPAMPKMGFFQGYNNTNDESYWVRTGKDDINKLGEVVTWANVSVLPESWWPTEYARSIRGTDSGSFSKMHLKRTDMVPTFQSFQCRSFNTTYLKDSTVHKINALDFYVPPEEYDTTSAINKGFRYRNVEKVNYYPDWPSCPDRDPNKCTNPESIDCSIDINLCHNCCNGSYVNGTYLLPPGIFPLVCYPGRMEPSPFAVMYSPPHFLYSPPQMVNSVYGLNPNYEEHLPMVYSHEPYSGSVIKVIYQLMVSTPMNANPIVVPNMHLPNTIVPMFWQGAKAHLYEPIYDQIYLGFVLVPKIVDVIKFSLLGIALLILALLAFCLFRRNRKSVQKDDATSYNFNSQL